MARNIIKLARALKSEITALAGSQGLAQYEIVYATDTKEIGVVNSDYSITWSGALNYTNIADNLRTATTSLKGLMSSTDKTRLDAIYDVFTNGNDENFVDGLVEVLEIFQNYPEGLEIMDALNDKVNKNPAITPSSGAVKVSYDTKGLITGSGTLVAGDIPNISGAKITSGKVGFSYLPTGVASTEVAIGSHSHTITDLSGPEGGTNGSIVVLGSGGTVTTTSGSTYLTPAQGNSTYLGINGTAANSTKLNNQEASYYLNRSNHTGSVLIGSVNPAGLGGGNGDLLILADGGTSISSISGNTYARLASPTFSGIPNAPTAAVDTNTTQIATTAFVMNQISVIDGGDL